MEISPHYLDKLFYPQPTTFKSERAELLSKFLGHDIKIRRAGKLIDASGHDLAIMLGHVPTSDLYPFFRQCEQARSFSRYFWWALKPKKV